MKKRGFTRPLLFKLTILALVVTLLTVGVTTFFVARFALVTLEQRTSDDLLSDAQIIKITLKETYIREETLPSELEERMVTLGEASNRLIRIVDSAGNVIADTMPNHLTSEDLITVELSLDDGGLLQVSILKEEVTGMLRGLVRDSTYIGLVVFLAAFAVAYYLNRSITNPIQDLLKVVRHLQQRQFGRLVLVRSTDEIGQLGRAFNELSETLEDLFFTISDREGKLETVLSSMDDGVVAVNMGGRVILANRAAADMFRLEPDSMIGKNPLEATRNEELSNVLEETIDSRVTITRETRMRPGSERILAFTSSPLEDHDGNLVGAVALLRDVTSLRHLEQVRQEFVANVSHELRTPLTSIKGFVETLLNGNLDDKELLTRFLGIINGETDRMVGLINDLLDLSRIESGKESLTQGSVDMKKVFDDTILILGNKAKERDITLQSFIYDPIIVEGDEKLLKQVAINLVDNGVKYTPPGGAVWIEAEQGRESVEFIISDNGLGISPEHLERIFERFYRVDKGRARTMGGTGLGLAITKHIIDRHKGTIAAESRVGKGTKMRVTLKKKK